MKAVETWRLSWIIRLSPKGNHMNLYRKEEGEDWNRRGESDMKTEAEIRNMLPQAKGCQESLEDQEARDGFSPRAFLEDSPVDSSIPARCY